MTSPFDRTPRPSIFANDPAFKTPRNEAATKAAKKAFKERQTGADSWHKTNTVVAYSKDKATRKGKK